MDGDDTYVIGATGGVEARRDVCQELALDFPQI